MEAVLHHRWRRGKCTFLVKWAGLGIGDNTWEPSTNLIDEGDGVMADALRTYGGRHLDAQRCTALVW